MRAVAQNEDAVIVFDIGGTFFRSGLYSAVSGLCAVEQQPALSFRSSPDLTSAALKQGLLDYLLTTARRYASLYNVRRISISLGAALDGNRGMVYGSGPLWGNDSSNYDLLSRLRQLEPAVSWHIVNDVTAGLIHYADQLPAAEIRKILLLTISTGIACRLIDIRNHNVALDEFGLQGEIGHLPVTLCFEGQALELYCDCGGRNHLSAFASGRGIAQLAAHLAQRAPSLWQASTYANLTAQGLSHDMALSQAVNANDDFACTLLYLATQPIADVIRSALTIDPEIDRVVLTGGVVVSLAPVYRAMLMRHLAENGIYLSSRFDPSLFDRRIVIAGNSEANNLIGAGLFAIKDIERRYHA